MNRRDFVWEIRPDKDQRTFELTSNVLPVGHVSGYLTIAAAIRYAKSYSGSHPAVIRLCDNAGNVIETHEHEG